MPETSACPSCQRMLRVPDELKGQSVRCPSCGNIFTAGADEPPPLPPVDPEPARAAAEAPRRRRALPDVDDYDDREDDFDYPRRRRRRRLDYEPHRGSTILVFGILAFFICGLIFGPIAWSMGASDLRRMREGRMDPEGEGLTKAGMICGIVATCLAIVGCVIYALIFTLAGAGRRF